MRRKSTKNRIATYVLGCIVVALFSQSLWADEPSLRELLDSIKPEGASSDTVAPSTSSIPTPLRAAPPKGLVARTPDASQLWSVPMPQVVRQSRSFNPQLWVPDPNASAAYRSISDSVPDGAQPTVDALRHVRYPQRVATKPSSIEHGRPLDWKTQQAPSAADYFSALQRARRNATEPQPDARVGRAQAHVTYGFDLARRGAAHSAEQEFTEALWVVAHANDARAGSRQHADQLRKALQTLVEVEEFSPLVRTHDGQLEACRVASHHKSQVARHVVKQQLDAVSAMQIYLDHAQRNLVDAIAGDGAGAEALYGLSRSIQAKSKNGSSGSGLAGAKAMALLLAAHAVKPDDHKITNELGVLYARFGELQKAERMLKRSLLTRERAESWHNLSRVWEMAGKDELARHATARSGQLKRAGATSRASSVRFVEPAELIARAPAAPEYTRPSGSATTAQVSATVPAPVVKNTHTPNWLQKVLSNGPFGVAKVKETTTR